MKKIKLGFGTTFLGELSIHLILDFFPPILHIKSKHFGKILR